MGLLNVFAFVGSIGVVGEAFLLRYSATSDDARLQIGDHGVNLVGSERGTIRVKIVRRGTQRPVVTRTNLVGALIESGHSLSARLPAADHELERSGVQPGCPQICPGRRFVALFL